MAKKSASVATVVNRSYLDRVTDKSIARLGEGEITHPRRSGRYDGVSIGRDKNGFFACTHQCRSKSYKKATEIAEGVLKWIKSTG